MQLVPETQVVTADLNIKTHLTVFKIGTECSCKIKYSWNEQKFGGVWSVLNKSFPAVCDSPLQRRCATGRTASLHLCCELHWTGVSSRPSASAPTWETEEPGSLKGELPSPTNPVPHHPSSSILLFSYLSALLYIRPNKVRSYCHKSTLLPLRAACSVEST